MLIDCDSCPGRHLATPACPTCVVTVLLGRPAPAGSEDGGAGIAAAAPVLPSGAPPVAVPVVDVAHPPVPVALVRRTDDLGAALDPREQRAVALLTARGLLAVPGAAPTPSGRRSVTRRRTA